ncbi:DUF3152 domain-containing protein [Actinacidiphila yanglinensis]|uniref:DUF3152 domain-containing protein n=1 Tax=Actinacidiphila yanglinensis TaxID=310779 RepID=UPI001F2F57A0|nr:DUF3152 domain-containing protein [Actinacidiphila yanglinensis]
MAAKGRHGRHKHSRRAAKRRAAFAGPLVVLCVVVLGCGGGYAAWHKSRGDGSAAAIDAPLSQTATAGGSPSAHADSRIGTGTPTPSSPSPSATPTSTAPSHSPSPKPSSVPKSGTGVFTTAHASGEASGHGDIRRYKVEVEGGIQLSAGDAAREIAGILADPRGWENDGRDGFQLVSSGSADFVIKIATPDTVDNICGAAGLLTRGEVNCDVGATVVVNLKRWILGSPEFDGPIHDYRALIINHEVGHRIGHGHEGCPGTGKLAPVMMQQIKGLHGCKANAWPYDSNGHYIQGPPVA